VTALALATHLATKAVVSLAVDAHYDVGGWDDPAAERTAPHAAQVCGATAPLIPTDTFIRSQVEEDMSHGITSNDHMFSVRHMPWHGLGVVLDEYPRSIDEALDKAGLGWKVSRGDVLVVKTPAGTDDFGTKQPAELIPAKGFKANLRQDTGEVLGIVSDEYEVVDNLDAFRFLDALIGSELYFETAGSLWGGRRVWVLARRPEYVELGGDPSATYIYVANSHDGSMAVTAAVTPIRIVCANTLGAALREAEHGVAAQRTFRFRHTGNLRAKFAEARRVLGMTIDYETQFKVLADRLAREAITERALEHRVLRHLWVIDDDTGRRARSNREQAIEHILGIFRGRGLVGDTTGNSPGSKWVAFNAIAEHVDYGRRYTARTNQMQRSFEDTSLKQRALEMVSAA
jgi:phage/plasmid-like protein (TIGR03299 family)